MQIETLMLAERLVQEDPRYTRFTNELRMKLIRSKALHIAKIQCGPNSIKKRLLSLALISNFSETHRAIYVDWLRSRAIKFQQKAMTRTGWVIHGRGTHGSYGGRRRVARELPEGVKLAWAKKADSLLRAADHFRDLADRIEKLPRLA